MDDTTNSKITRITPQATEGDYRAQGLRILARIIAQAHLRNGHLKGNKSNKHRERKPN